MSKMRLGWSCRKVSLSCQCFKIKLFSFCFLYLYNLILIHHLDSSKTSSLVLISSVGPSHVQQRTQPPQLQVRILPFFHSPGNKSFPVTWTRAPQLKSEDSPPAHATGLHEWDSYPCRWDWSFLGPSYPSKKFITWGSRPVLVLSTTNFSLVALSLG